ncbi:MAG: ester cyclase [Novosphingobium sp.]|nr:ester cyclase [Novosphingobium sp.]
MAADLADRIETGEFAVQTATVGCVTLHRFRNDAGSGWSRHVWSRIEGEYVVGETLIEDGAARCRALGYDFETKVQRLAEGAVIHPPLGELRAGSGQFAAGETALLPLGLHEAIRPIADAIHRALNGRDFAALDRLWAQDVAWTGPDDQQGNREALVSWIAALIGKFDDAVLLFEDAVMEGDRAALLWRLHGHHSAEAFGVVPAGARVRLIGSTVLRLLDGRVIEDETLIDPLAAAAQLRAQPIAY